MEELRGNWKGNYLYLFEENLLAFFLEELKKITKYVYQDIRFSNLYSNRQLPGYKSDVLMLI
jgi:hypothetical protein